ncbi:unnamed protein product [Strongylus vulgaris]|uniref:Uncharacterized protein n=1 Tax=Strongylus vulgaris TaxID=40348 RepID=A0A3P7LQ71_STRVU|nr:unnamed protein product [Strongylus vulgaris]
MSQLASRSLCCIPHFSCEILLNCIAIRDISQAEKEFDVFGSPDAQLRVDHARNPTVWLIKSLGGSLIHIGQRLLVVTAWQDPARLLSIGLI